MNKTLHKYTPPWEKPKSPAIVKFSDSVNPISEGGYWVVKEIKGSLNNTFRKITLVKKESKNLFSQTEIQRQLRIHYLLKKAGIRTFTTFRSDGESFYSTPLNTETTIALSSNNNTPKLYWTTWERKDVQLSYIINNIDEIWDQIIEIAIKASKIWLEIYKDSIFFNIDISKVGSNWWVNINSIGIYDFDIVKKTNKYNNLAGKNIENMRVGFNVFLQGYSIPSYYESSHEILYSKLSPKIEQTQIWCKNGIIELSERKPEMWEVISEKEIKATNEMTTEEVLHLCQIPWLIIDMTDCKPNIKNYIKEIKWNIIDNSLNISYQQLSKIYWDALFPKNVSTDSMKILKYIWGDANYSSLKNWTYLPKSIWGMLYLSDKIAVKSLPNNIIFGKRISYATKMNLYFFDKYTEFIEHLKKSQTRSSRIFDLFT